jgi:hypothetical protein
VAGAVSVALGYIAGIAPAAIGAAASVKEISSALSDEANYPEDVRNHNLFFLLKISENLD